MGPYVPFQLEVFQLFQLIVFFGINVREEASLPVQRH